MKSIMVQRFLFGILKIMKEWTSLTYLFFICGLISSINGQQFPVFGQGQQIQGQGNPAQFQQFLQTRQAAPGVGGGTAAGGTATGLTNSVRTVTVPILPAPPGTDLTQGTTFTQFQRGATQTASSDGPIPRFTQGSAFLGRPFTQFGPNMRPFAQGQQMDAASMAAAQQRQAQMQQNAQQFQARQQAGMAAQQAGMAASRTQFPGQGLGENGQMLVLTNRAVNNIRAGRNNIGRTNNLNGVRATRPASSLLSVFALQPGVLNGAGVQGRSVQRNGQQGQSAGVQQPTRTVVQRTNGAGRGTSIAVQRTNGMPRGTNGVNRRQAVTVRRTRLGQNSQGLAQRQQAAVQNQQGQQALLRISTAGNLPSFALIDPQSGRQLSGIFPSGSSPMQGAGTLWRPDVRMPGMMTPPGGAFPPRRFPGMFPPGFVNRNIARQNGAATGITGASNALNAPRAQQTQNRLTPPIMNPRDPRLGLMPVQANLQMFGSRQRPFPTPNVAATQTAMNRQNRMNTNAMTAAATNRINPNFPPVNSQFTGAVGSRTMPVNVGTPQGMARRPMTPNFGAFPGGGGRAMPSSVGAFPGSGGGALPSNVGAFPGGSTNTDMSANQIVPSNVDMFPGIGSSSSSTDGSIVTNELPGEISAFPGAESSSGSSASATTEFIGDIPAFPGAESIGASIMTSDLPVFPALQGDVNADSTMTVESSGISRGTKISDITVFPGTLNNSFSSTSSVSAVETPLDIFPGEMVVDSTSNNTSIEPVSTNSSVITRISDASMLGSSVDMPMDNAGNSNGDAFNTDASVSFFPDNAGNSNGDAFNTDAPVSFFPDNGFDSQGTFGSTSSSIAEDINVITSVTKSSTASSSSAITDSSSFTREGSGSDLSALSVNPPVTDALRFGANDNLSLQKFPTTENQVVTVVTVETPVQSSFSESNSLSVESLREETVPAETRITNMKFSDTTDLDPMTFDPTFPSFPESGTDLTSFAESRTVNQIIPNDSSMSAVVTGAVSSTTSSVNAGDSNIGSANSEAIFPNVSPVSFSLTVNGEEPGLTAGEIPPPPPVFPAKDINNIPASADAELFPPFDLGRGSTPFSENIPPVPAGEMMGSRQDFRRVNSASTLDVTMVEPNSRTDIKPAVSSFPGANTAEVTPPKTGIYQRGNGLVMAVLDLTNADKNNLGEMMQILQNLIDERNRNMAAPVMTEPTEAPSFSEFPSANFESSFPGAGTSSFPGASTSSIPESGTSSFPGAGTDVASSFPGMGSPVESPKSSVSISGSEVPFVASGFPGSEARSEVNSFPGSDFISAPSANQATETPSGMATFPGSGSNMSGFPGMRTEKSSTVSTSKGVVPPGTVSGIEGFERTESPLSSSIGGVPIELWQR
ncbi:serine-rich adhesin for platelets-like isoform X6 [Mytilus trossulus]|uniref:serine-rich adhesin for platelets-like isoform X6 n=1 Tax=Mytilus trossulus TaxID=6551 RepID=UPI003005960F